MITLVTGLVAGSLHVVSGPDHISALAPIAVEQPRRAARLGALWGLGHGTGVLVLGGLGIWARESVNVEILSAWSEYAVGVLLIGMALWSFRVAKRLTIHSHSHSHQTESEAPHRHLHVHIGHAHDTTAHAKHGHAAFGIGALHGAAGAGHLFGVLPSLALAPNQAVLYLGAYFVSAVVAMTAVGAGIGRVARGRTTQAMQHLMWSAGLVALAVGVFWLSRGTPLL